MEQSEDGEAKETGWDEGTLHLVGHGKEFGFQGQRTAREEF